MDITMNDGHPADGNQGLFSGLFKKLTKGKRDEDVTEEIMDMVNESHEQGVIAENEAEMIGNIFEFAEKQASDVMTHRKNIVALDASLTVKEAFDIVMEESYSRYPVYDDDIDNIIGILHIRDLLKVYVKGSDKDKKLYQVKNQVMFDPFCIPETRSISVLFKEMQSKKNHFAVVVDEYGQTTGIITMEDILEELVGNIFDEHDEEELEYELIDENTYMENGNISMGDLGKMIGIEISDGDYETLSGYLLGKLEELPPEGEETIIEDGKLTYKIEEYEDKRIKRVKICKNK